MSEKKKLLVVVTNGFHDERSSAALTIANSGINTGLDVTMFLISSGVDLVRKGAADRVRVRLPVSQQRRWAAPAGQR